MPRRISKLLRWRRERQQLTPPSALTLTTFPASRAASALDDLCKALRRAAEAPASRLVARRTVCAHVARLPLPAALLDREGRVVAM